MSVLLAGEPTCLSRFPRRPSPMYRLARSFHGSTFPSILHAIVAEYLADATPQVRFRPLHTQARCIGTNSFSSYITVIVQILNSVERRDWGSSINLTEGMVKISR